VPFQLGENRLTALFDLSGFDSLTECWLYSNRLHESPLGLESRTSLQMLDVSLVLRDWWF
jgi:hypothetical protein